MYLDNLAQYIVVLLQYACHISQYIVIRLWHIETALVKSEINRLQDLRVDDVELSWSPGHANIKGNELADQQAKEAAREAKYAEDLQAVSSFEDVKMAAKESGNIKMGDFRQR